jgi:hypothetical protein
MAIEIAVVTGSIALLGAGLWMLFWPIAVLRCLPNFHEDLTPPQAKRNVRLTGAVLLLFGWAGLHLVFVEKLKPFPPGENGVGF